jgi:hypothetical protein
MAVQRQHRSLSVALTLLGIACASGTSRSDAGVAPAAKVATAKPELIEFAVPDKIAGFKLINQERFENRDYGTMYRYAGADSLVADVFVFPGPALGNPCDTAVAFRAIEDQVAGFREGFPMMIQQHYVDEIAVAHDDRLARAADDPWCAGRHLTLNVIRNGFPQRSDFYLYALPGYFVKVRTTFAPSASRLALHRDFIAELFPQLVPKH